MKKFLTIMLVLAMVLSCGVTAFADEAVDYTGKTVILHTNDMHGAIDGYAKVAALKADFEAKGAEVILVDAGDYIQGTTNVSFSKGATAIELMNATGYDIVTLGNHEFDYGYANLVEILDEAEFSIISNVKYNGEIAFAASETVTTASGLTIGFVGLTTPETATKAHPAKIQGVTFTQGAALYADAQATIDSLDTDLVIVLGHLGIDEETAVSLSRSTDLYANVTGVDFIIDGHSHTVMTEGEKGEPIQSTGSAAANVGVLVIGEEGIEDNFLIDMAELTAEDEDVKALAGSISAEVDGILGAVFATTEVLLDGNRSPGVRTQPTNLGDLIVDAILWQATKDGGLPVPEENVVAITNGGGIRATIQAGDITMKDINTVLPFGNTVAFVYITGAELLEALEASTFCTPDAVGAFPQTSGIKYTLDTTKEFDQGELYADSTYYAPASINRVSIQSINGKPFDPTATYAVVTNDFTAAGGDTYGAFAVAENVIDTGVPMDEAVVAYITEVLGGVVTAEKYGKADDELTIIEKTPAPGATCRTEQNVTFNGEAVEIDFYNVDNYNYFQLRDIAYLLGDVTVEFDADEHTVTCTTNGKYEGELGTVGEDLSASCVASDWALYVDGVRVPCYIYNIGGYNYLQLRDLADALGFTVGWDADTLTASIVTK